VILLHLHAAFRRLIIAVAVTTLCAAAPLQHLSDNGKPYLEIPASPNNGFNYPYLIFTPPQVPRACFPHLLVEINNGPDLAPDDAALVKAHSNAERVATHYNLGNELAQLFGAPRLVPVFPRPPIGTDSDIDTYSLSRAALFANGKMKRLDLQLAAMIADAQARLLAAGNRLERKVAITGYSASALFASRFTFLHPDLVAAAAFGGLNSFIMLPVANWHNNSLEYPLGLADYRNITGHAFDAATYATIPQLAFQGENDTNDAVPMDDEYTAADRDLIWALFGKTMFPERWKAIQAPYGAARTSLKFRAYQQIGHGLDRRAIDDVFALFARAAGGHCSSNGSSVKG
jgi:hypothetical protein